MIVWLVEMVKLDLITKKDDECYTPKYAVLPILKYLEKGKTVWCPFDTEESYYYKILKKEGFEVIATHIQNGKDFFQYCPDFNYDYIISNPPYSKKTEVLKKLFEIGKPFAMLVGVVGLFESNKRFEMFKDNDFEIMYFDKRVAFFKDFSEQKPQLNPPFSSIYVCKNILHKQIVFERINKKEVK